MRAARTLADVLRELASLGDRYRLLGEHAAGAPGRNPERRDRMRLISARFPGALRELDCIGADGVARRGLAAERALESVLAEGEAAAAALPTWVRGLIEVQPRLREVLRVKRFLAERGLRAGSAAARQSVRAWYDQPAGGDDPVEQQAPSDDFLRRLGAPPRGQVQQVAYEDAARVLGMTADQLKQCLYPTGSDGGSAQDLADGSAPTSRNNSDDDALF